MRARIVGLICMIFFGSSCSILQVSGDNKSYKGVEKIFLASFSDVWRAAQLSLSSYPLAHSERDRGELQTAKVPANQVIWSAPSSAPPQSPFSYYILRVILSRGEVKGKKAIRVKVQKNIQLKQDFFSEPKKIKSNGLEERVILYRIGRELSIDKGIERAHKKDLQKSETPSAQ